MRKKLKSVFSPQVLNPKKKGKKKKKYQNSGTVSQQFVQQQILCSAKMGKHHQIVLLLMLNTVRTEGKSRRSFIDFFWINVCSGQKLYTGFGAFFGSVGVLNDPGLGRKHTLFFLLAAFVSLAVSGFNIRRLERVNFWPVENSSTN